METTAKLKVHKTTFTQKQKLVEEKTTQDWIVQGAEKQALKSTQSVLVLKPTAIK